MTIGRATAGLVGRALRAMSKKIIRSIMNTVTWLTPSPKKRNREKDNEKVNSPRNDASIADATDKSRCTEKTEV